MASFEDAHRERQKREAEEKILKYEIFAEELYEIKDFELKNENYSVIRDDLRPGFEGDIIKILPELNGIWARIRRIKDSAECDRIVRELLEKEGFLESIDINALQKAVEEREKENNLFYIKNIWFGSSSEGINLRLGDLSDRADVMRLDDNSVHGLMAGRTGSGKSNALHVLITSLLYEYAPWELNINLADFKIIEMSKYGNTSIEIEEDGKKEIKTALAPHVKKIAATDSMEYVLSVMYDMYEKMDIRQKVFAALNVQKLSDFRKRYNVVLPREILIVDEFQQMYELSSPKQIDIINHLIKMITKLGRATGFHLFFASQSLSGTIGNDVISNFKLRMCLPATEEVSAMILGNNEAANLERGFLLANDEGGDVRYNKTYQVPLIRTEKNERDEGEDISLIEIIRDNFLIAEKAGYTIRQDFYRSDYIRPFEGKQKSSFESDLNIFQENLKNSHIIQDNEIENLLLLGDSCVYARRNGKDNTLEYLPLKIAVRKNIVCAADSIVQRAYIFRLLAYQYNICDKETTNYLLDGEPAVTAFLKDVTQDFKILRTADAEKIMEGGSDFYKEAGKRQALLDFTQNGYTDKEDMAEPAYRHLKKWIENAIKIALPDAYKDFIDKINKSEADGKLKIAQDALESITKSLYGLYKNWDVDKFGFKKAPTINFWINGFHTLSDVMDKWGRDRRFPDIIKKCTAMGIRFVFVGPRIGDLPPSIKDCLGYYFLMTNDENNYIKADVAKPLEYRDNVLIVRAVNEVLNEQKPGLYILRQDIKMVKAFDLDDESEDTLTTELFKGICG